MEYIVQNVNVSMDMVQVLLIFIIGDLPRLNFNYWIERLLSDIKDFSLV